MKNSKIVAKIKELSSNQVFLKNQRRTVNLQGERQMLPSIAAFKHWAGRDELRHLYHTYAVLRGKEPQESKAEINPVQIGKYLKQYKQD